MNYALCFLPAALFMIFLVLMDSFNLVRAGTLVVCFAWGLVCSGIGFLVNSFIALSFDLDFNTLSRYIAPFVEEILKAGIIFWLAIRKKTGFIIDAAIYGFAVGTGFSLVENFSFLIGTGSFVNIPALIIRGFGTGIMHGGCTAFMAVLYVGGITGSERRVPFAIMALLPAILFHSAFNHFPLNPLLQTLFILVLMPALFITVFRLSIVRLQRWLELEFCNEIEMLNMIRRGQFGQSPAGRYLKSLRERFAPDIIVDMYCYIELYLELSVKAKRNLMLTENGFERIIEDDLHSKLEELAALRKRIGKVGELALAPLIRMNYRNLWKLNQLT